MSSRKIAGSGPSATAASAKPSIYRAPWLVTVDSEPDLLFSSDSTLDDHYLIEDGGVCVAGDRIIAVGHFADLQQVYGGAEVVHYESSILTPSLVNAHVHLELSHLAGIGDSLEHNGDLPAWIKELVAGRESCATDEDAIIRAGKLALHDLYASGTGLLADIGNQPISHAIGSGSGARICFFLEILGMSTKAAHEAIAALNREEGRDDINRTVHAPYSCHADLIRAVKERSRRQQRIFPLHVAESAVEVDFLRHGTGGFRELLVARNVWDDSFVPLADNNQGSVNYLDGLGVIDSRTLCVHAVHVSKQEITLLAEKRAKVCICPGSNRYLGVGRAPVADMLASGIVPALGTDSLASNRELNLWQEMKIVRADHPGIRPSSIFAMATRSGAEALGYGDQLGRLHQGLQASVLAVASPGIKRSEVFDYLTTIGRQARVRWACSNAAENGRK